ncbi:MAG: TetR/AcrR family transcriptional regulator [Microlunatus sp.]|nr:TetR/AcrR family transcriptional regulator [Microlunatus sp.]
MSLTFWEYMVPKIDAPTVAEHRANVQAALVDAAEAILRAGPSQTLTAGAVSAAAGIARNSIYRYVDSVDDLRALVVDRYLPDWLDAVSSAMATAATPEQRVTAWVAANLEQAAETGHGWLMGATRAMSPNSRIDEAVVGAHADMWNALTSAWQSLLGADPDRVAIAVALTVGILDACFRQLDADQPVDLVLAMGIDTARALTTALRTT